MSASEPSLGALQPLRRLLSSILPDSSAPFQRLSASPALIVVSDYSGQHPSSDCFAYSFLVTTPRAWKTWEPQRQRVRVGLGLERRTMSYKRLGDAKRRKALPAFLQAADCLDGLLVTFLIRPAVGTVFDAPLDHDELQLWRLRVREHVLRVSHLGSFLIAYLASPGQDVLWITDEDCIAANYAQHLQLTKIVAHAISHLTSVGLGRFRLGLLEPTDNGTLRNHDLAAIPDLAAGAAREAWRSLLEGAAAPEPTRLRRLLPEDLPTKAHEIFSWLASTETALFKTVIAIEPASDGPDLRFVRLGLWAFADPFGLIR
jgi:hypothetical protein